MSGGDVGESEVRLLERATNLPLPTVKRLARSLGKRNRWLDERNLEPVLGGLVCGDGNVVGPRPAARVVGLDHELLDFATAHRLPHKVLLVRPVVYVRDVNIRVALQHTQPYLQPPPLNRVDGVKVLSVLFDALPLEGNAGLHWDERAAVYQLLRHPRVAQHPQRPWKLLALHIGRRERHHAQGRVRLDSLALPAGAANALPALGILPAKTSARPYRGRSMADDSHSCSHRPVAVALS